MGTDLTDWEFRSRKSSSSVYRKTNRRGLGVFVQERDERTIQLLKESGKVFVIV